MVKERLLGKTLRMSFSKNDEVLEIPNLIEVQKKSFKDFAEHDIGEMLTDISPMADYSGNLIIEFVGYLLDETPNTPSRNARNATLIMPRPLRSP